MMALVVAPLFIILFSLLNRATILLIAQMREIFPALSAPTGADEG
jgi:hypothetical protein